jgi:hypothetical protein
MPRIPYRFPPAGTDTVADAIRERRGVRGLTPLDGALLNAPAIAVKRASYLSSLSERLMLISFCVFILLLERLEHVSRFGAQQEQLASRCARAHGARVIATAPSPGPQENPAADDPL